MASFIRWLQIKKYQYEVTFSLYMLNSTEKIIFNLILLTLMSLLITAAVFYLPDHVLAVSHRIWYYIHGEFYESMTNGLGQTTDAKSLVQAAAATATTTATRSVAASTSSEFLARTAEQVMKAKNEL